ncbi:hypothetical protein CR513_07197, partial [Mucuna pruriens]
MDRSMINAASGGALMDKTPAATRQLISNMFGTKGAQPSRAVNEARAIDNLRLENQLTELMSLVRQLVVGQHQQNTPRRVCGICTFVEHPTNMCPTAKTRSVSAQKKYLGPEGAILARQPSPASKPKSLQQNVYHHGIQHVYIKGRKCLLRWLLNSKVQSYHTHFTLLTLSLHSSMVHGASVWHLVDRRGATLESRKLEVIREDRPV